MAEKLDSKEMVSFEELLMSRVTTNQAIINLLVEKGILTKGEILAEVNRVRQG